MPDRIGSYRDLLVWQQAMDLAVAVYTASKTWPKDELYGLTAQARRAATSGARPISPKASERENRGSYLQFLRIAQGSLKELETHLLIAHRILPAGVVDMLLADSESVGELLRRLVRKLSED